MLKFEVTIIENNKICPETVEKWFQEGGIVTAIGTYRPQYGRFMVKEWDVKQMWSLKKGAA